MAFASSLSVCPGLVSKSSKLFTCLVNKISTMDKEMLTKVVFTPGMKSKSDHTVSMLLE